MASRTITSYKRISKNLQRGLGQQRHILAVDQGLTKKQQPLGRGRKAVFVLNKIILIIFALDKKIASPNRTSPVGKQGRAAALDGSPTTGGRGAAFTPPPHVFVTQPPTLGVWAPYPGQPRPRGHPPGPVPGRGRGQPRYSHAAR
ncbi:hypothetical protein QYF61_018845 [Mycteria americana]|uniref:Uncharacterized protein n=1 Tax=Mycteria americana TaxID=33587 RepID=A0AAN7NL35_MYCAM|nr:hypothetical protein QYF61_018845 [Mycteria americana]